MSSTPAGKPERLDSVDALRGLVMVLMALDHTRDFFASGSIISPENAAFAPPALFFTRWITHICAPTFFLLTGVGAGLARAAKTRPELTRYLVTRALGVDTTAWLEMSVGHASITEIRVEADGRFKVISIGDLGHIPPNMQTGATGMTDKKLEVPK